MVTMVTVSVTPATRARLGRAGTRLLERVVLVEALVVTVVAVTRVPVFLTGEIVAAPTWWTWSVPPGPVLGWFLVVATLAGWAQYAVARIKMRK